MAVGHIKDVKISAIACCVPEDKLTINDFYNYFEKDIVDKFVKDTGIRQKYYSKNRKIMSSDLCFAAAQEIFEKKNIDRDSIDALIFISQTPDYVVPATACTLQYRLNLSENCLTYDVNLGCTAYVQGLQLAASHLQNGTLKRVLLLVGETHSTFDKIPHLNNLLFGDSGSATLLEYEKEAEGFRFNFNTIGSGFKTIGATTGLRYQYINNPSFDPTIHMDGIEVFTFTITKVPRQFKYFFKTFNSKIENYTTVFLHQANKSMIDLIAKKIKANKNKVPISLDRYANTSCASIPTVMCDYYGNNQRQEELPIIMAGFGIGLSLGIIDAYINPQDILPIISTNITWDEGRDKVLQANDKLKK